MHHLTVVAVKPDAARIIELMCIESKLVQGGGVVIGGIIDAAERAAGVSIEAIDKADAARARRGRSSGGRGSGASGSGFSDPAGAVTGKAPQPGLPDGSGPAARVTSADLDALRRQQEEALAANFETVLDLALNQSKGGSLLLLKPTGQIPHMGGQRLSLIHI